MSHLQPHSTQPRGASLSAGFDKTRKAATAIMGYFISLGPLAKGILVVAWLLVTIFIGFLLLRSPEEIATARIVIHLGEDLQRLNLHFGVLHVRDGKDEVKDSGDIANEAVDFTPVDRHGTMQAVVRYRKRLGFQFKCFVDYGEYDRARIEQLLSQNSNFTEISEGQGAKFRMRFIL
jgi:hypothetical protein